MKMIELLPLMIERVGILVIVAFLLSKMQSFRQIIHNEHTFTEKISLIMIFGLFGIISNYTGVLINNGAIMAQAWNADGDIDGAIANTRIMGVVIGGLLGGPFVGLGVGVIAGVHRLTLGGFTAVACALSTIIAGIATGVIGKRFGIRKNRSPYGAVVIGILMECMQMGIILLIAKPYESALNLVEVIAIPMIVINAFGTLLFIFIIQNIFLEKERLSALQTQKALYIAQQTLPFFRQGLNPHSCKEVAEIMLKGTNADAIAITNQERALAHVGVGLDHHNPSHQLATRLTKRVLESGEVEVAKSRSEIQCFKEDCPLQAAIVLPLKAHDQTVGSLKIYYTQPSKLDTVEKELAEGLSRLFSTQLELAEAELQRKLLKDAEIKALHAQVHPHFFFNAMNTISSLIRTDADKARKLLLNFSTFFRSNLQGARQILIPLEKELEHVEAYLTLEQARFPDKYQVEMKIDPGLKSVLIPPFTLQPLVENSIRHAFPKMKNGKVAVTAQIKNGKMVLITEDNGMGIPQNLTGLIGKETVHSDEGTGTALWNIKKRIEELYGQEGSFTISSGQDCGTKVSMILPLTWEPMGELR